MQKSGFQNKILSIKSNIEFEELCLELFYYQSLENQVYKNYINALNIVPETVQNHKDIPFLPIEFFKTHKVQSGRYIEQAIFTSSGTTGENTSKHYVENLDWYKRVFLSGFELFYGDPEEYCLLALLPSYLERQGSSLVYMVEELIRKSNDPKSGFYLRDYQKLSNQLMENEGSGKKTLLLGVTFALLDFAEKFPRTLRNITIMETGGMKGMRKELTRQEVSDILINGFDLEAANVHSEYGMTELMSQAYSKGDGFFQTPPWMKLLVREPNDPLVTTSLGSGALNIIDLANIDSCAFIATQDLGTVYPNGDAKILGRMDKADIRGCNLLVV